MTSEKQLREIAAQEVRDLTREGHHSQPLWEDHPDLTETEWGRVVHLIDTWPILDLPAPDRDGFWWPEHGRNYGNVHVSPVYVRDVGEIIPMVTIARGGPGEASRHTRMNLTREEALELASLLTAAAMEKP